MLAVFAVAALARRDTDAKNSLRPRLKESRIRHFECFNVVRLVEQGRQMGRSRANLTAFLESHCERLIDPRRDICLSIVPDKVRQILLFLEDNKPHEEICSSLGFKRIAGPGRVIEKDQCIRIVDLVKADRAKQQNTSRTSVGGRDSTEQFSGFFRHLAFRRRFASGSEICREVEENDRKTCHIVARLVLRTMPAAIEEGASSRALCSELQRHRYLNFSGKPQSRPRIE
jgi:hypothetical protein